MSATVRRKGFSPAIQALLRRAPPRRYATPVVSSPAETRSAAAST